MGLAVLAEEAQCKQLIIGFLVNEYNLGFALLLAGVDGLAKFIF